jgi:hypothetical protein
LTSDYVCVEMHACDIDLWDGMVISDEPQVSGSHPSISQKHSYI